MGTAPAETIDRVRLLADVAGQRVRLAKEELRRARKRLKEAKRESKRARRLAAAARKVWKRARKRAKKDNSGESPPKPAPIARAAIRRKAKAKSTGRKGTRPRMKR